MDHINTHSLAHSLPLTPLPCSYQKNEPERPIIFGTAAYRELWQMACAAPDPEPVAEEEDGEQAGEEADGAGGEAEGGARAGDAEDDEDGEGELAAPEEDSDEEAEGAVCAAPVDG